MKKYKMIIQKIIIACVTIVAIISINMPNAYAALSLRDVLDKGGNFISAR